MVALCPSRIPGSPGTLTPDTWYPGADSATSYHTEGSVCGRCGSPPSSAPPPATAGPFTAHALLSGYSWICPDRSWLSSPRSAPAACATLPALSERPGPPPPLSLTPATSADPSGALPPRGALLAASAATGVSGAVAYGPG